MNYCAKHGILCENANAYGNCSITACSEYMKLQIQKIYSEVYDDIITFPQTIGNITFYTNKELIKWVEDQQRINEDPNYGIGNWA